MHIPVLREEILSFFHLKKGNIAIDCTMGLGGHLKYLAESVADTGLAIGIEWDEKNFEKAKNDLRNYTNIHFYNTNYTYIESILQKEKLIGCVDAVLFDLGVSSPHLDEAERGFSFSKDGPLDMRFSHDINLSAADIINTYEEKELATIFNTFGEEPLGRKIAKAITQYRAKKQITRTTELTAIIRDVFKERKSEQILPRIFQALRIAVNGELLNIEQGLIGAFNALAPQGKIAVISFHSLEDRIVKNFFKEKSKGCICPKEVPLCVCHRIPQAILLTKKPILPSKAEVDRNSRARSAKLRILQKI